MSTTLADAELVDRPQTRQPVVRAFVTSDRVASDRGASDRVALDRVASRIEASEDNVQAAPGRGIVLAVLIAAPVWALIAASLYLLL